MEAARPRRTPAVWSLLGGFGLPLPVLTPLSHTDLLVTQSLGLFPFRAVRAGRGLPVCQAAILGA